MKINKRNATDDVSKFKTEFTAFMQGKQRNAWLYGGSNISVYIRKGRHLIGDKIHDTLDIANISIEDKGKGTGTKLFCWLHEQNPFGITLIESILNERLYIRLKKDGWEDVPNSNPPSVFLKKI